jgi:hypothetical protein
LKGFGSRLTLNEGRLSIVHTRELPPPPLPQASAVSTQPTRRKRLLQRCGAHLRHGLSQRRAARDDSRQHPRRQCRHHAVLGIALAPTPHPPVHPRVHCCSRRRWTNRVRAATSCPALHCRQGRPPHTTGAHRPRQSKDFASYLSSIFTYHPGAAQGSGQRNGGDVQTAHAYRLLELMPD